MQKRRRTTLALTLAVVVASCADSADDEAVGPPSTTTVGYAVPDATVGTWERWGATDSVTGVDLDAVGRVLATTVGGVVAWAGDGSHEVLVSPPFDDTPSSIAVDSEGGTWLGFRSRVARWDGRTATVYELPADQDPGSPLHLAVGPGGSVWAAADHLGLLRFDGDEWATVVSAPPGGVRDLAVDGRDRVFTAGSGGVYLWQGTTWQAVNPFPASIVESGPDGDLWFAVRGPTDLGEQRAFVGRIDVETPGLDPIRHAWIMGDVTVTALAVVADGAFAAVDPASSAPAELPTYPTISPTPTPTGPVPGDPHSVWWLAEDTSVVPPGEAEPLPGGWDDAGAAVGALAVDDSADLWLGSDDGVWQHGPDGTRHHLTGAFPVGDIAFVEVGGDEDGTAIVWVGNCDRSATWRTGEWRPLPERPEGPSWPCGAAIGRDGTLWLAGSWGIARLVGDRWELSDTDDDGSSWSELWDVYEAGTGPAAMSLVAAADGSLWAAVLGADWLWRWDGGAWRQHSTGATGDVGVSAIASGGDGRLWVATDDGDEAFVHPHLRFLDDGAWQTIALPAGVETAPIAGLAANGDMLWAESPTQVLRFDGADWLRLERPPHPGGRLMTVDAEGAAWIGSDGAVHRIEADSRTTLEVPLGDVLDMDVASDGSWWFGGSLGVARWTPTPG